MGLLVKHEFDMSWGLVIIDKLFKFLSNSSHPACIAIIANIDSESCNIVETSRISERDAEDRVVV